MRAQLSALLFTVLLAGCDGAERLAFKPSPEALAVTQALCGGEAEANALETIFPSDAQICVADTNFNTMLIVDVVTREPASAHPSMPTRVALTRLGTMGRYDEVAWGVNSAGDVTWFNRHAGLLRIGDANLSLASYGGCLALNQIYVTPRQDVQNRCYLQVRPVQN